MAVSDINAVNLRGKSKAVKKETGKPTKESIKAGMMGGFGAFSQESDFGNTNWGDWGSDWSQQPPPPPPTGDWTGASGDPFGDMNWQGYTEWDFGGGYGTSEWGANWGDDPQIQMEHAKMQVPKSPLPQQQATPLPQQQQPQAQNPPPPAKKKEDTPDEPDRGAPPPPPPRRP